MSSKNLIDTLNFKQPKGPPAIQRRMPITITIDPGPPASARVTGLQTAQESPQIQGDDVADVLTQVWQQLADALGDAFGPDQDEGAPNADGDEQGSTVAHGAPQPSLDEGGIPTAEEMWLKESQDRMRKRQMVMDVSGAG